MTNEELSWLAAGPFGIWLATEWINLFDTTVVYDARSIGSWVRTVGCGWEPTACQWRAVITRRGPTQQTQNQCWSSVFLDNVDYCPPLTTTMCYGSSVCHTDGRTDGFEWFRLISLNLWRVSTVLRHHNAAWSSFPVSRRNIKRSTMFYDPVARHAQWFTLIRNNRTTISMERINPVSLLFTEDWETASCWESDVVSWTSWFLLFIIIKFYFTVWKSARVIFIYGKIKRYKCVKRQ